MVRRAATSGAEARIRDLRWPDGVICTTCGSAEVAGAGEHDPPRWRCRRCRRYFTVTAGTALHASKLPLASWEAAAHAGDDSPAGVSALLGVSAVTARRVSRVLRSVGAPPGEGRLAALLAESSNAQQASAGRQGEDPLEGSPEAHRRILAALRVRFAGATAALAAEDAGLSVSHARRCLRRLEAEGFVRCRNARIAYRYRHRTLRLWELRLTERTVDALPRLAWRPASSEGSDCVPPEYWWLFWSSTNAADLRLPEDSLQIAGTLIGGPDYRARAWALSCLPVATLSELRTMRGYDTGETARMLDSAVGSRSGATHELDADSPPPGPQVIESLV